MRASGAEVGLARQRERCGPLAERLEERDPGRDRGEGNPALEAGRDDLGDAVGVELRVGGDERPPVEVVLAGDAGALGLVVEDVADEELAEGALLFDHEQLLEAPRELAHDAGLHREEHPDLEEAHAVAPQRRIVEAELAERLAQVVIRLAGRGDAEPGGGRVERDPVQPVRRGEGLRRLEPAVVDLALRVEPPRGHEQRVLARLPRPALVLEAGIGDHHAVGRDLGRADLVGDVGDDLRAHPEAGIARELEAEPPEVEDLLDRAREDHREERVVERHLRVRRQRRRLRERIVAAERQHAAIARHAREVGVLEDVARAVDAGALAVPHAEDAVVLRPREEVGELAPVDRGGAEVLVEAREEDDVVLAEEVGVALERQVEAAERRAAIPGDQRRGVEAAPPVGAVLVERQPDEGLDAGKEDDALLLTILGVQTEVPFDRHDPPCRRALPV